jgi:(2R)-3-sulfolactate dehydrogenase (NADP+)
MGGAFFAARMTALAAAIESQLGARLPGSRRLALRAKALESGIAAG